MTDSVEPSYGWLSHVDPLTYQGSSAGVSSDGFALFLAQVIIILALCYILGAIFQRLGQPKVAGELLAGVCLGPTVFGNIPGFTDTIVPSSSLPLLTLTSNIGLVFFILLVGLETDTDLIKKYARQVALIALPGMAVPFAVSVGLAKFVYEHSTTQQVEFTTFMLFVATVMAVTSLSVLSRVLSELRLLNTVLGSVTIAAGALNDLIGYLLLALGSSLGSGGEKINALYQLLVAFALALFQWFIVRPIMFRLILRSGFDLYGNGTTSSSSNMGKGNTGGDTTLHQRVPEHLLAITLLGALISAWITEACSLHPILGSLLFGIALPHHNFAIRITESIETLVVGTLLPLYFVTSGLNANFKLLNTGLVWGQIFLIFIVVFVSKFASTTLSAKVAGFTWRESSFVAALMQSKSIIELIILNAGLEIGVLNKQVYAMLFITFIFSTLTVRPLATTIYSPLAARVNKEERPHEETEWPDEATDGIGEKTDTRTYHRDHFAVVAAITSANPSVQGLMSFVGLVGGATSSHQSVETKDITARIAVDFLRLLPSRDHSTANIMRLLFSHNAGGQSDEVLAALKTTAALQNVVNSRTLSSRAANDDVVVASSAEKTVEGGDEEDVTDNEEIVSVSDDASMVSALRTSLARAREHLRLTGIDRRSRQRSRGVSELGRAMVVVAWESAIVVSHSHSWLQTAAVAAGFVDAKQSGADDGYEDDDGTTSSRTDTIPQTLMTRLRDESVGILVDAKILESYGSSYNSRMRGAPLVSLAQRRQIEEDLWRAGGVDLSQGRLRKSRVVVPFFGGNDDRAAVELCERMALQSSNVEAIVVSIGSSKSDKDAKDMQTALAAELGPSKGPDDGRTEAAVKTTEEGDETQTTVNLKTIHQREAEHADARFLFGREDLDPAAADDDDDEADNKATQRPEAQRARSDKSTNAAQSKTKQMATMSVRQDGNVTIVDLEPRTNSDAGTDVEQVLSFCLALVDEQCGDVVLVGRGKTGQRPRQFRGKVEAIVQKRRVALNHNALAELRSVGRTLGAAAEGCLAAGIQTCMLVVQAGSR